MKKFLLFLGVAGAALSVGTSVQAADAPAYGDLYNVEWCPCNPEEPFDADGSVVMGKNRYVSVQRIIFRLQKRF